MKIVCISINKETRKVLYASISIILVLLLIYSVFCWSRPAAVMKEQLSIDLKEMFIQRDRAALLFDTESIKPLFDTSGKLGLWAYEHEKKRTEYLKNWSIIRGSKFTLMESDFKIQRIREKGASIWIDYIHSGKFTYIYPDMPDKLTSFGIGTRRTMEIAKKDDKWIIKREWYLDPFEDILEVPDELKNEVPQDQSAYIIISSDKDEFYSKKAQQVSNTKKSKYNRDRAVAYADKYSGATFGSGNNYKYNRKYRDFTGIGGDCSNFTSQVLSDKEEGGGLRMDGAWHYSFGYKGVGGGTMSWVRAESLKNYLLYSGKVKLIKKGTLEQVMGGSEKGNEAYKTLQKADLVAYEEKGKVVHFSVITAIDPKGLPLVNSHTTDRYRVPWDLGWSGKKITYWLLHVRD